MTDFSIRIDLSDALGSDGSLLNEHQFPHLAYAVERLVAAAHEQWVDYAHGAPLPDGSTINNRTGEYARSILSRKTGNFSGEVYSELPYAGAIEEGSPSFDMKKMLNTSLKVRLSKDGRRYLIIPFRHNAPGSVMGNSMPVAVAKWWKGKTASYVNNGDREYKRKSGTGAYDIKTRRPMMVPAWRYKWGDRLGAADLAGMGITGKPAKHMEGMVNFRNAGGPGQPRAGSHSKFLTFRIMIEGGKGWIAPAQPGKFPARSTMEMLAPVAEASFAEAVKKDVQSMLGL